MVSVWRLEVRESVVAVGPCSNARPVQCWTEGRPNESMMPRKPLPHKKLFIPVKILPEVERRILVAR
jgi:hypothetical protein